MSSRSYPRVGVKEFGHQLLRTQDLDPIYTALEGFRHTRGDHQARRWAVAYWCFYHAGVASVISEYKGKGFWRFMMDAAVNNGSCPYTQDGRWPRGRERRHFRGKNGIAAVAHLQANFEDPEDIVDYLTRGGSDFAAVSKAAQSLVGFGPWISWKVADMLDRCLGVPVDFAGCDLMMYRDPAQAAGMVFSHLFPDATGVQEAEARRIAVAALRGVFGEELAPPTFDRPVDIQELETILCKWKAHVNGFYPPGEDTHEIRAGLAPWVKVCHSAGVFLAYLPNNEAL